MNTAVNVALLSAAVGLVTMGVQIIATDLVTGAVEILLGIAVFAAYELAPSSGAVPKDPTQPLA